MLTSLDLLWSESKIIIPDNILFTPLWYNDVLQIPIRREWLARGVTTIWDLIGSNRQPMVLEEFENTYYVKTNFLEYGEVCRKVSDFLIWKDKPDYNPAAPYNCMLNIVLSIDTKEVSNTYKLLLGRNRSIIEKTCDNWNEKLTHIYV